MLYTFKVCTTRISEVIVEADSKIEAKDNLMSYNNVIADDLKSEEIDETELMNVEE